MNSNSPHQLTFLLRDWRRGDAMNALAAIVPTGAKIVEPRFFGGLSVEKTAEVLGVSDACN